jgi:AraC family transcriptional regulator
MQGLASADTADALAGAEDWAASLAHLLKVALRQVDADRAAARAVIVRASALLQVQIDRTARHGADGVASGGLTGWQIRRILSFIDQHLDRPMRVEDLRRVANLSASHFSRTFKRTFHEAPQAYMIRRRVEHARHLMLISDMPLSEVAQACGFTDQAHFCRKFRRQIGQSPAAWRREHRDTRHDRNQPNDAQRQ